MSEAKEQFASMVKSALPFMLVVLSFVFIVESVWLNKGPYFFLGTLCGCAYALLNLWLLFSMLAPYFFRGENPLYILYAGLISLAVGCMIMFVASSIGEFFAIGVALGIASPAVVGTLHSVQTMKATSRN